MQDMAAADGEAGDHRHHRLGRAANLHLQVEHVGGGTAFVDIAFLAAHLLVAARTEGLVAGAGQDDGANGVVVVGAMEGVDQLLDGFRAEGIAPIRPVDGDLGDPSAVS